jgi:hypothetical protein
MYYEAMLAVVAFWYILLGITACKLSDSLAKNIVKSRSLSSDIAIEHDGKNSFIIRAFDTLMLIAGGIFSFLLISYISHKFYKQFHKIKEDV